MAPNADQHRTAGTLKHARILLVVVALGQAILASRANGAAAGLLDLAPGIALFAGLPLAVLGWGPLQALRIPQRPRGA